MLIMSKESFEEPSVISDKEKTALEPTDDF